MICKFIVFILFSRFYRIIFFVYSFNGEDILVSYFLEYIYFFGLKVFVDWGIFFYCLYRIKKVYVYYSYCVSCQNFSGINFLSLKIVDFF